MMSATKASEVTEHEKFLVRSLVICLLNNCQKIHQFKKQLNELQFISYSELKKSLTSYNIVLHEIKDVTEEPILAKT